ncbi:MAG: glucose 1-dehydrogenase [Deltaproteobacteria bacterium]|nr:glucose 1-dehydrogenase [Deltaproteobacteria bacterium]
MTDHDARAGGRLAGKIALVTGAARGQGEAEARLFAAEGAKVVLGDVLDDDGRRVAAAIGDAALYCHHDVGSEESWTRFVAAATERFGPPDVLVNNAGILRVAPIAAMSLDEYRRVIEVNQFGCFLGMRAVIPPMAAKGGGAIVNIASTGGLQGIAGLSAYVSSKFAIRGLTKTAAIELGSLKIRVNVICPGAVDTAMGRGDDFGSVDIPDVFAGIPIPRIGRPDEVARAALFLASDEASYCTGAELLVDGGMLAGPSWGQT